jgi:hypothetical protein
VSWSRDDLNDDYTRTQSRLEDGELLGPESDRREDTTDRAALHRQIVLEIVDEAISRGVPSNRHAVLMGGVPASGKTTIRDSRMMGGALHLVIDTDDVKRRLVSKLEARGELPDIRDIGAGHLQLSGKLQKAHSEASDIVTKVIAEAMRRELSLVIDDTMRDKDKTARRVADLHRAGYQVEACYVHAPIDQAREQARTRCIDAWLSNDPRGGSVMPPEVWTKAQLPGGVIDNARIFVELAQAGPANGGFDRATFVDNTGRRLGRDGLPGIAGVTWEAGIRRDRDPAAARHLDQVIPPHLRGPALQR